MMSPKLQALRPVIAGQPEAGSGQFSAPLRDRWGRCRETGMAGAAPPDSASLQRQIQRRAMSRGRKPAMYEIVSSAMLLFGESSRRLCRNDLTSAALMSPVLLTRLQLSKKTKNFPKFWSV